MTTTLPTSSDNHADDLHLDRTGTAADILGVSVHRLSAAICVLAVDGEVDLATAPQLDAAVRKHHLTLTHTLNALRQDALRKAHWRRETSRR